jgi:ammonia channel protein AmtB
MLFQLRWLIGASAASFILALISNQILKAIGDEIGVQTHHARGGIFGAVMGLGTGVLGTPRAKKSVQGLRERLFSTGKSK